VDHKSKICGFRSTCLGTRATLSLLSPLLQRECERSVLCSAEVKTTSGFNPRPYNPSWRVSYAQRHICL